MALPENIFSAIPGKNPSGENLRQEPIFDKIKEARREEDNLARGDWTRPLKVAEPAAVVRMATETLSTKTKDLLLAAWLAEALLRQDGIAGLTEGIGLIKGMIENFWETLYPEPDEGDMEPRTAPLNWVGSHLGEWVKRVPLTISGYDWFKYLESRSVGYEKACAENDVKRAARQTAISEHKLPPEIFDQDMKSTEREFYVELIRDFEGALACLLALNDLCNEKLGRESPSFVNLRTALEDVQSIVQSFLSTKEPVVVAVPPDKTEIVVSTVTAEEVQVVPALPSAANEKPVDREDAIRRINSAAAFLRQQEPGHPAPYLLLRGMRWGDLIARAPLSDGTDLQAPASETRQKLRRLALDGQWTELLEASESTMALPCGMAWLDLQHYTVKACQELGGGYDAVGAAIRSGVTAILDLIPDFQESTFADGTAVANAETIQWLQEISKPAENSASYENPAVALEQSNSIGSEEQKPDSLKVAMQAARCGRMKEAMEILTREIGQQQSGRARFEKKMQLASVCLATGHESVAYPILKDLAQEIERRKLEEWESPTALANSLVLLLRCIEKMGGDEMEKQEIYQRICRLDPVQALSYLK